MLRVRRTYSGNSLFGITNVSILNNLFNFNGLPDDEEEATPPKVNRRSLVRALDSCECVMTSTSGCLHWRQYQCSPYMINWPRACLSATPAAYRQLYVVRIHKITFIDCPNISSIVSRICWGQFVTFIYTNYRATLRRARSPSEPHSFHGDKRKKKSKVRTKCARQQPSILCFARRNSTINVQFERKTHVCLFRR